MSPPSPARRYITTPPYPSCRHPGNETYTHCNTNTPYATPADRTYSAAVPKLPRVAGIGWPSVDGVALHVEHSVAFPSFCSPRLQVSTTKPRRHQWIGRSGPRYADGYWAGLDETMERGCPVQSFPRLIHPENTRKDLGGVGRPLVWFLSLVLAPLICHPISPSIFQPSPFTCSISSSSHISPRLVLCTLQVWTEE